MRERQYRVPSGEWRVEITDDEGFLFAVTNPDRSVAHAKAIELIRTPDVPKEGS